MVGVKVSEEHRFQAREVHSCVGEAGRRPAATVDDEDASVDDERGGDPRAAGHGHGRARRAQEDQFGCHARLLSLLPFPASLVTRPLRAGGGPGRLPPGEAMPVKSQAAQPAQIDQQHRGTRRDDGARHQRIDDDVVLARRGRLRVTGSIQPYRNGSSGMGAGPPSRNVPFFPALETTRLGLGELARIPLAGI